MIGKKFVEKQYIFIVSKYISTDFLLIQRGNDNLSNEKPDTEHLNRVMKSKITNNETT